MWIFCNDCFVSAVQHNDDPNLLVVRARVTGHIEAFFSKREKPITVERHEDRDYLYRTVVTKDHFADVLRDHAVDIDYGNFKDSIEDDAYHSACSRVWSIMNGLQELKHGVGKYISKRR